MIKFIYERDDNDGHEYSGVDYIEMRIADEMNLEFMLVHYAEFLRALGYRVNGEIGVLDE